MPLLNVKVGDRVAYNYGGYSSRRVITEVIKVTPTGRIRIAHNPNMQFDKWGHLMGGSGYHPGFISRITPETEKQITEENTILLCYQKIREIKALDYKTAVKLLAVLEGGGVNEQI